MNSDDQPAVENNGYPSKRRSAKRQLSNHKLSDDLFKNELQINSKQERFTHLKAESSHAVTNINLEKKF